MAIAFLYNVGGKSEDSVYSDILDEEYGSVQHYDLSVSAINATVSVTRNGNSVSAGTGVLTQGDVLTITASAGSGYEMSALTVNGVTFTSGNTYTVTGDVAIIATAEQAQTGGIVQINYTFDPELSDAWKSDGDILIYDGTDNTGTYLGTLTYGSSGNYTCTSGFLFVVSSDSMSIPHRGIGGYGLDVVTTTGNIYVNDSFSGQYAVGSFPCSFIIQVSGDGTVVYVNIDTD